MIWRSTTLGKIERYCLAVLAHDPHGEQEDRRIYEVGTAAHGMLEAVQRATNEKGEVLTPLETSNVTEKVMELAAEYGRSFDGRPEVPLRPDAYLRGRRMAETWLIEHPLEPGFDAEVNVIIDRWGSVVAKDDPNAWAQCILDHVGLQEMGDEEGAYVALVVGDFKSDWQSGRVKDDTMVEVSLNNAQRRIQALCAFEMHRESTFSALRLEVHSLPRRWTYVRELDFEEIPVLDEWRQELVALTDGYEARMEKGVTVESLASPGACCMGCPYLGKCKPGRSYLWWHYGADPVDKIAQEDIVLGIAAHQAEASRLRGLILPIVADCGSIVAGETEAGFFEKPEAVVSKDAAEVVWATWQEDCELQLDGGSKDVPAPEIQQQMTWARDLLSSYLDGVVLGSTSLKRLLSRLWPLNRGKKDERDRKREIRDGIMLRVVQMRMKPVFEVRTVRPPEPSVEDQLKASLETTNNETDD